MARKCDVTGKGVLYGNNVSHANNKSSKRFLPNVRFYELISDVLSRTVSIKLSTHGLRTVEHNGGLDAWLLKSADRKLTPELLRLKRQVVKATAAGAKAA
jgi:large subunit ribosomal protein L28